MKPPLIKSDTNFKLEQKSMRSDDNLSVKIPDNMDEKIRKSTMTGFNDPLQN